MLPFIGKAHVAYIPTGRVLGLSKIAGVVDMFARRLQIQENLTKQIADAIQHRTDAAGVAVVIEAKHKCMMMRGVEKQKLGDDHVGDAGRLSRVLRHASRVPATDRATRLTPQNTSASGRG